MRASVVSVIVLSIVFGLTCLSPLATLAQTPSPGSGSTPQAVLSNEAEPNDLFSTPNPIAPSSSVSGGIDPVGDHDWYSFIVGSEGELSLIFTGVAEEAEIVLRIWNANKDQLQGWQGPLRPGADTDVIFDAPESGTYYLEVAESGDNLPSPYSLQATFVPAPDPGEPNNRFADATPLTPGTAAQGNIFPTGEHDWYSFDAGGRAQVHVLISDVAPDLEMVFRVWNSNKDQLLNWQGPPRAGADTDIIFDVAGADTYYLELAEGGDNARSTQAYSLLTEVVLAADAEEDNGMFMTAESIDLGPEVVGAILPRGDHDWYKLEVGAPGTLEVSIVYNPADLDMVARVWNGEKATVCNWQGPPRDGADTEFSCDVAEPGTYYIEVADGGDNARSPEAYHLTATVSAP